jgi:hypothetical protein
LDCVAEERHKLDEDYALESRLYHGIPESRWTRLSGWTFSTSAMPWQDGFFIAEFEFWADAWIILCDLESDFLEAATGGQATQCAQEDGWRVKHPR